MESELKIVTIELRYWSCFNQDHRHRTKQIADACIKRTNDKIAPRRWTDAMYAEVRSQRENGMTFKEIGETLGVTASRARSAWCKALRLQRHAQ